MFILLYFVILFVVGMISKKQYGTILRPNVLFSIIWVLCASLASFGLFNMYKISLKVQLYVATVLIVFNVVFLLFYDNSIKANYLPNFTNKINIKLVYVLNLICWIYMIRFLKKSIVIILTGGFNVLRLYAFNSSMGLGSTVELIIAQNFVQPVFVATIIIATYYFNNNRQYLGLFAISIIDMLIYTLAFSGRGMLTSFIAYYIIFFVIFKTYMKKEKKKTKIKFRTKLSGAIVILGAIGAMIILTRMRSWEETSFLKEIYYYTVGPFSFLQVLLDETNIYSNNFLYGKATFGFIYNLIAMPVSYVLGFKYKGSDYIITGITSAVRYISPERSYNALTTMLYPFLLDFGYLGVIFGTSFFAFIICYCEKKYKQGGDLFYFLLFCLLVFQSFNSIKNYYLYTPNIGVIIILLFIFTKSIGKNMISEAR